MSIEPFPLSTTVLPLPTKLRVCTVEAILTPADEIPIWNPSVAVTTPTTSKEVTGVVDPIPNLLVLGSPVIRFLLPKLPKFLALDIINTF